MHLTLSVHSLADQQMPFSSMELMLDEAPSERSGSWVTTHVELVERLAEGAMGELWRGYHHTLASPVAVKVILEEYRDDRGMLERFHMEAIAAARVKHPYVVQIYDHGTTADGTAYIVMELFEGETLRERIDARGPVPIPQALAIAEQLADALDAVHEQGVVHRDVKPDNIALIETSRGVQIKLFDFGVASVDTRDVRVTEPGTLLGTPAYMSVEQMLAVDEVDHRTDVWALAVVLYEMLTGRLPFDDRSLRSACAAITAGRYYKPTDRVPTLGGAVDEWFARAVDPSPDERYQSSSELVDALKAVLRPARDSELCRTLPSSPALAGLVQSTLRSAGMPVPRRRGRSYFVFGAMAAATTLSSWSFYQREAPPMVESVLGLAADRTGAVVIERSSILASAASESMPPPAPDTAPEQNTRVASPRIRAHSGAAPQPQGLPAKDLGF